jgi:hypothetical protein
LKRSTAEDKQKEQNDRKDSMVCDYHPDYHPISPLHKQSKIQGTHADFCREKTSCIQETAHVANKAQPLNVGRSEKYRMSTRTIMGQDPAENSQHYPLIKLTNVRYQRTRTKPRGAMRMKNIPKKVISRNRPIPSSS